MKSIKTVNPENLGTEYRTEAGDLHRADGPASSWVSSDNNWNWDEEDRHIVKCWDWWLFGKWHRYYGPSNMYGEWAIHGKPIK